MITLPDWRSHFSMRWIRYIITGARRDWHDVRQTDHDARCPRRRFEIRGAQPDTLGLRGA